MSDTLRGRTIVDIKAAIKHADIATQSLPTHAHSGCDTVLQLYGVGKGKGKGKVLKVLLSQHRLDKLGELETPFHEVLQEATPFVTSCYGAKEADMTTDRFNAWASKML